VSTAGSPDTGDEALASLDRVHARVMILQAAVRRLLGDLERAESAINNIVAEVEMATPAAPDESGST